MEPDYSQWVKRKGGPALPRCAKEVRETSSHISILEGTRLGDVEQ